MLIASRSVAMESSSLARNATVTARRHATIAMAARTTRLREVPQHVLLHVAIRKKLAYVQMELAAVPGRVAMYVIATVGSPGQELKCVRRHASPLRTAP